MDETSTRRWWLDRVGDALSFLVLVAIIDHEQGGPVRRQILGAFHRPTVGPTDPLAPRDISALHSEARQITREASS